MSEKWESQVQSAVRDSQCHVVGEADIVNEAQAIVVNACLKAFGSDPTCFVYIEPCTADSTERPPDVLICHKDIGILVIEVKGFPIEAIDRIEAGTMSIKKRNGDIRKHNPWHQVRQAMFSIINAIDRRLEEGQHTPLYNYMVAFPSINEMDWVKKRFPECVVMKNVLLSNQINNKQSLKDSVNALVTDTMKRAHKPVPLDESTIPVIKAAFGDSAVINPPRTPRPDVDELTLGAEIDDIEQQIKILSEEQQELSRLDAENHPRLIRGVAGSGKTIVLANMVASLLKRDADKIFDLFPRDTNTVKVGVVCFNRTLVPFIIDKVATAFKQKTHRDLPANVVKFSHFNGFMKSICQASGINHMAAGEYYEDQVRGALYYQKQIRDLKRSSPRMYPNILFDVIFVDEGQDLIQEEFALLLDLIKPHGDTNEKPIIIFYDDAQNLYGKPRPVWQNLGIDVRRGDRARVMKICYRNTKEIIELAYNVLLGSMATQTTRTATREFADVNYLKREGLLNEKDGLIHVNFTTRNGPQPIIKVFDNPEEKNEWICDEVIRLVEKEEVRPEDILILAPQRWVIDGLLDKISKRQNGCIQGFNQPHRRGEKDEYIFSAGNITMSTIHSAKGYDAPVVFLIGGNLFQRTSEGRATFYVGATRAKHLLYIAGLNRSNTLSEEANEITKALWGSVN